MVIASGVSFWPKWGACDWEGSTESDSVGGLAWRQPLERPACSIKVIDIGEQFQGETGRRQGRDRTGSSGCVPASSPWACLSWSYLGPKPQRREVKQVCSSSHMRSNRAATPQPTGGGLPSTLHPPRHWPCPFICPQLHLEPPGQAYSFMAIISEVAQSCPTLCDPVDCSPPGPPSMGFSRQEYWRGLPFPSPGELPDPGIEPRSPALQADSLPSEFLSIFPIKCWRGHPKLLGVRGEVLEGTHCRVSSTSVFAILSWMLESRGRVNAEKIPALEKLTV